MINDGADSSSPLDTERCLIITLFKTFSRIRKKEYAITFYEVIKVHRTILGRLSVRHDDYLDSIMVQTRHDKPPGRKKKPATENFRLV